MRKYFLISLIFYSAALSASGPVDISKIALKAVVKTSEKTGLLLREGPGRNFKKITVIPDGETVVILEPGPNDEINPEFLWFKVKYGNLTGWVHERYLDFESAENPEIHTATGKFSGISWGDYCHMDIMNDKGEYESYWIYNTDEGDIRPPDLMDEDKNNAYKGKKVILKWREIIRWIPEAGQFYMLEDVVSVELIEK